jgi:hypothetical protein
MADDDDTANRFEHARRIRNIAIALALGGLVVLFFVMTMVRLKGHVVAFFQ